MSGGGGGGGGGRRAVNGACGVQRFPSYRQEETGTWSLVRYHFCSIDTWLAGECRSHCAAHDWRDRELAAGARRSVFALGDAEEDASDGE